MSKFIKNKKTLYKSVLSKDLKEFVELEFGEDEMTREEALQSFQKWVTKQSYIKNCPTDPAILIRFLRETKFSVIEAQKLLLYFLSLKVAFPQWYTKLNPCSKNLEYPFDKGIFFPLQKKDDNGRTCLFFIAGGIPVDNIDVNELFRATVTAFETMNKTEENQIRGFNVVADFKGMGPQQLGIVSPKMLFDFLKALMNIGIIRFEYCTVFNMEGPFAAVLNAVKNLLSSSFHKKFQITSKLVSIPDLPMKNLPKEYGGEVPMSVMLDKWNKERLKYNEDLHKDFENVKLDSKWKRERIADLTGSIMGLEGNFRKLNID